MFKNLKYANDLPIITAFFALFLLIVAGEFVTARIVKNQFLVNEAKQVGQEWVKRSDVVYSRIEIRPWPK